MKLFSLVFVLTAFAIPSLKSQDVTLEFPNNNFDDILAIYQHLTGKTVISLIDDKAGIMVALVTPGPVSKENAIALIEETIKHNGFRLEEVANGAGVKLIPEKSKLSRNAVVFQFKDDASKADITEFEKALAELQEKFESIVEF